jgi:hypothetical protein
LATQEVSPASPAEAPSPLTRFNPSLLLTKPKDFLISSRARTYDWVQEWLTSKLDHIKGFLLSPSIYDWAVGIITSLKTLLPVGLIAVSGFITNIDFHLHCHWPLSVRVLSPILIILLIGFNNFLYNLLLVVPDSKVNEEES